TASHDTTTTAIATIANQPSGPIADTSNMGMRTSSEHAWIPVAGRGLKPTPVPIGCAGPAPERAAPVSRRVRAAACLPRCRRMLYVEHDPDPLRRVSLHAPRHEDSRG